MGYFLLEAALFALGLVVLLVGRVPLPRRRVVRGSAAWVVGVILLVPLPVYLVACRQSGVPPLGLERPGLDPLQPVTVGFVRLGAVAAAFGSVLAATVFAIISSETRRRD